MAHIPPGVLAELWRTGQPLPALTEPRATSGYQHVLAASAGWTGKYTAGGDFIHFQCPHCKTHMFQSNTDRGLNHALRIARAHKPGCCAERQQRSQEWTAWPDRVDE